MNFENPMFITLFTSGMIFILAGIITKKFPPKGINMFYGYRTKSSMKNKERWDFAQSFSSKEIIKYGIVMCVIGLVSTLMDSNFNSHAFTISIIILLGFIVFMIYNTERAIKSKFDH